VVFSTALHQGAVDGKLKGGNMPVKKPAAKKKAAAKKPAKKKK
jgi:hypothetical protein